MQCCASLLPSFLSSSYISATLASESITLRSLLCNDGESGHVVIECNGVSVVLVILAVGHQGWGDE